MNSFILDNPNESHSEFCLICLDNMGQISIYSLPTLRRQIIFNCIKPTDISALSSCQFTPYAHAFYLQSSSELTEISFTLKTNLSYTMMISYNKLQRKTILRSVEDKRNQETPSKDSITSLSVPKSIEPEEPVSVQTGNNSGFSTHSDSAIDVNSPSK
jgi:lethal(2) giant larvae protein